METRIFDTSIEDLKLASEIIKSGGLVAFPTETVYGLGANALDDVAVKKVYEAKGRPSDNPMIVHISSNNDMAKLTDHITDDIKILMRSFWPGPLTMVVPAKPIVPRVTTGGLDTVAIRMPNSLPALRLIEFSGVPIAAPSANISGRPSPTTYTHVMDDLDGRIDAVIEGEDCEVGIESTVIDMTGDVPMILRPGIITKEELSQALGKEVLYDPALFEKPNMTGSEGVKGLQTASADYKPKAPGMKYKHYAPKAEMQIYRGIDKDKVLEAMLKEKESRERFGEKVALIFYDNSDPKGTAKTFFANVRECDKQNVDLILVSALDEKGVGFSVMNRMLKSAGYNVIDVE